MLALVVVLPEGLLLEVSFDPEPLEADSPDPPDPPDPAEPLSPDLAAPGSLLAAGASEVLDAERLSLR